MEIYSRSDISRIEKYLGIPLACYVAELQRQGSFIHHFLKRAHVPLPIQYPAKWAGFIKAFAWRTYVYAITRATKPKTVIETWCGGGMSVCMILLALHANRNGMLYSIDLPGCKYYTDSGTVYVDNLGERGRLIPDVLRDKWRLVLGKTEEKLDCLLKEVKRVDLFLHDSEHTYRCMSYEYNSVWPYLRLGGLIVSDDVSWSKAFSDFARESQVAPCYVRSRLADLGIIIKGSASCSKISEDG